MNRPTVVVVTDEPEFSATLTRRWLTERIVPSFALAESTSSNGFSNGQFDLAIVGGITAQTLGPVLDLLKASHKPLIHVSRSTTSALREVISVPEISVPEISVPEINEWPDLVVTLATQIFERARAEEETALFARKNAQLDHHAVLGRYMLDARHNLNNALTSILGNADLLLMDAVPLPPAQHAQIETIHNMAMRLNEIMQRFSSLQKEMQLVEQQSKKLAKGATAGKR